MTDSGPPSHPYPAYGYKPYEQPPSGGAHQPYNTTAPTFNDEYPAGTEPSEYPPSFDASSTEAKPHAGEPCPPSFGTTTTDPNFYSKPPGAPPGAPPGEPPAGYTRAPNKPGTEDSIIDIDDEEEIDRHDGIHILLVYLILGILSGGIVGPVAFCILSFRKPLRIFNRRRLFFVWGVVIGLYITISVLIGLWYAYLK